MTLTRIFRNVSAGGWRVYRPPAPAAGSARAYRPCPTSPTSRRATAAAVIIASLATVLLSPAASNAEQRVSRPEFSTPYDLPDTSAPQPRGTFYDYLDTAMLAAALAAASYLALRKRSRRGLFVLMLLSLLYFGFWRGGCVCPIGAIQVVSLGLFGTGGYVVPVTIVLFLALPLVFTLFFGRAFCGAVCPLGAIQDVVLLKPVRVPSWLEHSLGLLPYVYLGGAVLMAATQSAFIICRYDPFVSFFRLVPLGKWTQALASGVPVAGLFNSAGRFNLLLLGACFLLIGVFVGRAYCRFVCPLGAVLRILSRVSWRHVTIAPDDCIQCRLCEDSCPFGAVMKPTGPGGGRSRGKAALAALLLLLPALVAGGGWLGVRFSPAMSRANRTVRLAERIALGNASRAERAADADETIDAVDVFVAAGRPAGPLYSEAAIIRGRFAFGGAIFGAFVGLVIGLKLIELSVRRKRTDYQIDRAKCLSCGRCFSYCPREQKRLTGRDT